MKAIYLSLLTVFACVQLYATPMNEVEQSTTNNIITSLPVVWDGDNGSIVVLTGGGIISIDIDDHYVTVDKIVGGRVFFNIDYNGWVTAGKRERLIVYVVKADRIIRVDLTMVDK